MREIQMDAIRSVERAVSVMDAFSHRSPTLTIDEICRSTQLPKATVYRILYTLERQGLIRFDPISLKYRLGFKFLHYADIVSESFNLKLEAEEELLKLYDITRQTVLLAVREGGGIVYIYRQENPEGLKVSSFGDPHRPLFFGAFGQVVLAYMEEAERTQLLVEPLPEYTEQTLSNKTALLERLDSIRQNQLCVETNEAIPGVTGIAAPIFDVNGMCVAAVGINGPTIQLSDAALVQAQFAVKNACERISAKLGYRQELQGG